MQARALLFFFLCGLARLKKRRSGCKHDAKRRPARGGKGEKRNEEEKKKQTTRRLWDGKGAGESAHKERGRRDTGPPRTRTPRQRKEGTVSPGYSGNGKPPLLASRGKEVAIREVSAYRCVVVRQCGVGVDLTPSSQSPTRARNAPTNGAPLWYLFFLSARCNGFPLLSRCSAREPRRMRGAPKLLSAL